jgi:hypothetical protein
LWFKFLEIIQKNIRFSIGIFKIGASNPMKLRNAGEKIAFDIHKLCSMASER